MFRPKNTADILAKLRKIMASKNLEAYIVPMNDEHNNEYIAKSDERIFFLSGFQGSFGFAAVTHTMAALWTDGRYIEHAQKSVDQNWTVFEYPKEPTLVQWLNSSLKQGSRIGLYQYIITNSFYQSIVTNMNPSFQISKLESCLVDEIWDDKPPRPSNPLIVLDDINVTGKKWHDKIDSIRENLTKQNVDAIFLYALDEIAWLFNLRGSDIDYNPIFFSFCVVTKNDIHLIMDTCYLFDTPELCKYLQTERACTDQSYKVTTHAYKDANKVLRDIFNNHARVWFDSDTNIGYTNMIAECKQLKAESPIKMMKCIKSKEEIQCMKLCAIEDSIALCRFFYWLEQEILKGNKISEADAAEKVDELRSELPNFVSPSFATISCVGSNGGMIHYKPVKGQDSDITLNQVYLLDSGGQYRNGGTTDVTRTVHFGMPTLEEKVAYTLVLKGYMQLASSTFPMNYKGSLLDSLARMHMWKYNTNYSHGTGHGVGSFLCVHEGPISFSGSRKSTIEPGLQPNMIITIEPGLYKPNCYGMRIESDFVITNHDINNVPNQQFDIGGRSSRNEVFLQFEPLTYFPIQTKMVDVDMLSKFEKEYINNYHKKVREVLKEPLLARGYLNENRWMMVETEPI